ncbi:hypothetical protein HNQ57_001660 [Zhongshania antarctica]|uniref:Glutaredoxin family protein n=1 Tax=Zhongshania antarctica TaxID=641702 RepID=A0A840R4T0_9GAMM|nr:glutaredoxin family protein [Zhongshania antarctica]MBB5187391.1 hypothetical protein [Zhongshania antarctica]
MDAQASVTSFVLYGTSACHLCELAEAVLSELLSQGYDWQIEVVDIADDDNLLERYALSIPVLTHTGSDLELRWPFDGATVLAFAREEVTG